MKFDSEIAERICREMGIEYHPEQEGVIIGDKKLTDDFSTEKLFRGVMREIHFYASTEVVEHAFKIDGSFNITYEETEREIIEGEHPVIHTTSMAHLSTDLFDYGIDAIWIHDLAGEPFCIKCVKRTKDFHYELECNAIEKELRRGHNLLKMWISGAFAGR